MLLLKTYYILNLLVIAFLGIYLYAYDRVDYLVKMVLILISIYNLWMAFLFIKRCRIEHKLVKKISIGSYIAKIYYSDTSTIYPIILAILVIALRYRTLNYFVVCYGLIMAANHFFLNFKLSFSKLDLTRSGRDL